MDKTVVIFKTSEPKVHSVRYRTNDKEAAISDVYIKRSVLGSVPPRVIKITIEEG